MTTKKITSSSSNQSSSTSKPTQTSTSQSKKGDQNKKTDEKKKKSDTDTKPPNQGDTFTPAQQNDKNAKSNDDKTSKPITPTQTQNKDKQKEQNPSASSLPTPTPPNSGQNPNPKNGETGSDSGTSGTGSGGSGGAGGVGGGGLPLVLGATNNPTSTQSTQALCQPAKNENQLENTPKTDEKTPAAENPILGFFRKNWESHQNAFPAMNGFNIAPKVGIVFAEEGPCPPGTVNPSKGGSTGAGTVSTTTPSITTTSATHGGTQSSSVSNGVQFDPKNFPGIKGTGIGTTTADQQQGVISLDRPPENSTTTLTSPKTGKELSVLQNKGWVVPGSEGQKGTTLTVQDGKLYQGDNLFSTDGFMPKGNIEVSVPANLAKMVLTNDGRVVVNPVPEQVGGELSHREVSGQDQVSWSGYVGVENGVLKTLYPFSGHYEPENQDTARALDELKAQGLVVSGAEVIPLRSEFQPKIEDGDFVLQRKIHEDPPMTVEDFLAKYLSSANP